MTNLKKLELLTNQLEWEENDLIDYVTTADYSILLVTQSGDIKWCNDYFKQLFKVKHILNKNISKFLDINQTTTVINNQQYKIKIRDLIRDGKFVHKKITILPHE